MDFKDACIVMTEGHIADDGKIYGKFNLVDTPVGRVVKTFIDSGVTFGISVRGAGDIINNSVDPETFVFRGFDLVTFPAYKEAIPEFKAIAASSDVESQQKYNTVCAAIKKDLNNISSCGALDIIQEQLPEQSETYNEIENRKNELMNEVVDEVADVDNKSLEEEKIDSLTDLYLEEKQRADIAEEKIEEKETDLDNIKIEMNKKLHVITRIVAAQGRDVENSKSDMNKEIQRLKYKNKIAIRANKELKKHLQDVKENNLQYKTKIDASDETLAEKTSIIRDLQSKLDETVIKADQANKRASNLDGKIESLNQQILASQRIIEEYQDAYASLYAKAVGVDLKNVSVTASTSVADLQKKITSSSAQLAVSEEFVEPQQIDIDNNFNDDDLVTL